MSSEIMSYINIFDTNRKLLAQATDGKYFEITSSVAKITVVVAEISFEVVMNTLSVAKIIFIVAEITFKVIVTTFSEVKITFVVVQIYLKVAVITSSVGQITL